MLHHPTKHHPTSISHFLALHQNSTATSPTSNSVGLQNDLETSSGTHLDAINTNIGKSFTIAAILGLKKNAAAAMDHHHNGHKDFAVMNLSMAGPHHGAMKANLMENMNNRVPMAFGQHLNQQHLHHPHHHSSSALQSLQQQFQQQQHQQHHANQNMPQFHAKERVKGKDGSMIYVDGFLFLNIRVFDGFIVSIENVTKSKSSLKSKRVRTIFTPEQLERLEAEFERQQYMVGPERLYLAHTLQLTEAQVRISLTFTTTKKPPLFTLA